MTPKDHKSHSKPQFEGDSYRSGMGIVWLRGLYFLVPLIKCHELEKKHPIPDSIESGFMAYEISQYLVGGVNLFDLFECGRDELSRAVHCCWIRSERSDLPYPLGKVWTKFHSWSSLCCYNRTDNCTKNLQEWSHVWLAPSSQSDTTRSMKAWAIAAFNLPG